MNLLIADEFIRDSEFDAVVLNDRKCDLMMAHPK